MPGTADWVASRLSFVLVCLGAILLIRGPVTRDLRCGPTASQGCAGQPEVALIPLPFDLWTQVLGLGLCLVFGYIFHKSID
ncbi:hypothetical protein ACFQE1_00910 [Halobium palmae]|uniref:Uncharacterized protein n=1 Tax=Halobium palmae TaxID=1776492 RepID=A0ABD5RUB0_9EURY